ncbi:MAG: 30S ribosomal protein S16 [Bdellovibrionales bacterium RBG_16_40_8]|nr:MAG: 30S ribosomal protein S16 [Bdellovibrionales bacterium RBG_16_40_8]
MVVIRLARFGKKHLSLYRVTVADQKYAATGRYLEIVGHFNQIPKGKDVGLTLKMDRVNHWIKLGAKPTERVMGLIRKYEKTEQKT